MNARPDPTTAAGEAVAAEAPPRPTELPDPGQGLSVGSEAAPVPGEADAPPEVVDLPADAEVVEVSAPSEPAPVFIREVALQALVEPLQLEGPDADGPCLTPGALADEVGLLAHRPFRMRRRYVVGKEQGVLFCEVTGDDNPIHSEGDVVPGAFTAAKLLASLEVLFPGLEVVRFTMKFTAIASYGVEIATEILCEPTQGGASFEAVVRQGDRQIAELEVVAQRRTEEASAAPFARRRVGVAQLRQVRSFFRALGVPPRIYFGRASGASRREGASYVYPRAFLASLPSGEMVRQLSGDGGLLNKLSLEFEKGVRVPITSDWAPLVELEQRRNRSTFNRILAAIKTGLEIAVHGTAVVLSGDAARRLQKRRSANEDASVPVEQTA